MGSRPLVYSPERPSASTGGQQVNRAYVTRAADALDHRVVGTAQTLLIGVLIGDPNIGAVPGGVDIYDVGPGDPLSEERHLVEVTMMNGVPGIVMGLNLWCERGIGIVRTGGTLIATVVYR